MPQQAAGYGMQPSFGNFINDPSAQIGIQMTKTAMDAGQQYMEQNVCHVSTSIL
jgi:hypothetical protein